MHGNKGFFPYLSSKSINGKTSIFGGHKSSEALVLICPGKAQLYSKHRLFFIVFWHGFKSSNSFTGKTVIYWSNLKDRNTITGVDWAATGLNYFSWEANAAEHCKAVHISDVFLYALYIFYFYKFLHPKDLTLNLFLLVLLFSPHYKKNTSYAEDELSISN